jgi:hypothetical protein
VKNASVADDKASPTYHHLEPRIAAIKENTVDNRVAPKTILYSCCDPARLSTKWSAFGGLSSENQSNIVSSIPVVPSRWENWRPMSRIYASAKLPMNPVAPEQWAIQNLTGAPDRPTSAAENFRPLIVEGRRRISEAYGIRKTMRGLPGALSQISSIVESGTVLVAICSLAGTTASRTFLIESSSFGKGTLLSPLPIN